MKRIHPIQEDEVIAEFLIAEVNSPRFREKIIRELGDQEIFLVLNPNLRNMSENELRKRLLEKVRGYGLNKDLFENLPNDIEWYSAVLSEKEIQNIMYINYSYWNELSNRTRLPAIAARNIKNGVEVYGVKNTGFYDIHVDYLAGKNFPRLILVASKIIERLVVLEGHARLTAYFLEENHIPNQLEVIIGYSDNLYQWNLY